MKIFHLNCGMLKPFGGKLINRSPARVVCHCILIDTGKELVLIDSGVGTDDIKNPKRLGPMHYILNLRKDLNDTAVCQISKLGYKPEDVKHIVLTHMDLDHTGGLADFPNAFVHVYKPEIQAANKPASIREKERYRTCHFLHMPKWVIHDTCSEEQWFGLKCIKNSKSLPSEIVVVPLTGHTRGHCAIAIKSSERWLLHAGDAYYYDKQIDKKPFCTPGFKLFQYISHMDQKEAFKKLTILRDVINKNKEITALCSHDPTEFESLALTEVL
ncbi:MAG: MBL fold metallo-hydrolase [Deltaproteobacteria bacterium]|nr:MBL fold metallo-hydrolase [Deltaproteobacteria bacterium]